MKPAQLARIYGVFPAQVYGWLRRGLHPDDPGQLFVELSRQRRPGRTFTKLADKASRAQIQKQINDEST